MLIGAGLIGVAMVGTYYADSHLIESIEIYNQNPGKKNASRISVLPTLNFVDDQGQHQETTPVPMAGLSIFY